MAQHHQLAGSDLDAGAADVSNIIFIQNYLLSGVGFDAGASVMAQIVIAQDHKVAAPELAAGAPLIPALVYDAGLPRQIDFNEPSNNVVAADNSVNQVLVA